MSNEKIGLCFGCFIPMHTGHNDMIQRSRQENDRTIVGVCGYKGDRGETFIPFDHRQKIVKDHYQNSPDVAVTVIDDHKIGLSGTFSETAWAKWIKEFFHGTGYDPDDETKIYTWYTGEESYIKKMQPLYPNHRFVFLDREAIPISGTAIRTDPKKYEKWIIDDFKEYLVQKSIINNSGNKTKKGKE